MGTVNRTSRRSCVASNRRRRISQESKGSGHVRSRSPRLSRTQAEEKGKVERRILAHKTGFHPRRRPWRAIEELPEETDATVARSAASPVQRVTTARKYRDTLICDKVVAPQHQMLCVARR